MNVFTPRAPLRVFIIFFITLVSWFSSSSLFSAYLLRASHDQILPSAGQRAQPPLQIRTQELNASLAEFNALNYLTRGTDEKIEREFIEKVSKNSPSLSVLSAKINDLIKHGKAPSNEHTALIRVYQALVLQQAMNDQTKKEDIEIIMGFIKGGAAVTKVDKRGNNALHLAAYQAKATAVQFLIPLFAKSCLLDAPDCDGQTALHNTALNGNVECIKALLDAGANLTAIDKEGNNALHLAVWEGNQVAVIFLAPLFAKAGLLEALNMLQETALEVAELEITELEEIEDAEEAAEEAVEMAHRLNVRNILWLLGAKKEIALPEVPAFVESAVETLQNLTSDEFESLLVGLEILNGSKITVPASLVGNNLLPDYQPLREAILSPIRQLQKGIRHNVVTRTPLNDNLSEIVEHYLFGTLPQLIITSVSSLSSSPSSSSDAASFFPRLVCLHPADHAGNAHPDKKRKNHEDHEEEKSLKKPR